MQLLSTAGESTIEHRMQRELLGYALGRKSDVTNAIESPEQAALLTEKFGEGLMRALYVLAHDQMGLRTTLDRLVREIDPDFEVNRKKRWRASRPTPHDGLLLHHRAGQSTFKEFRQHGNLG